MIQEIIKSLIPEPYTYGSKITKQDIDAYEKKIQYSLPEAYRLFLLMTNGGVPVNHFVWTRGIDCLWHRQSPNSFLGLHTRESWSELGMIENSGGNSRHGYLPIAYDPGGNRLLMNLNTDDIFYPYGAIYFSDDEYIL